MSMETRLKKLEAARPTATGGMCKCLYNVETRVFYPGKEPDAEAIAFRGTCDECGGERRMIRIGLIDNHDEVEA
jgi:hypothetical protein